MILGENEDAKMSVFLPSYYTIYSILHHLYPIPNILRDTLLRTLRGSAINVVLVQSTPDNWNPR